MMLARDAEPLEEGTLTEHGIEEETVSGSDIVGELRVEQLCLGRLLITLDQDLTYPHGSGCEFQKIKIKTAVSW